MEFTAVNREQLQQAFALAHRASEDAKLPQATRAKFRQISTLLWKAHGENGKQPPEGCGRILAERIGLQA